jgi:hypothetical protein
LGLIGKILDKTKMQSVQWRMCKQGEVLYSGDIRGSFTARDLRNLSTGIFEKKVGNGAIKAIEVAEGKRKF